MSDHIARLHYIYVAITSSNSDPSNQTKYGRIECHFVAEESSGSHRGSKGCELGCLSA